MPGFVNVHGVCADGKNFRANLLEFAVQIRGFFKFGRADKGEIRGIKEQNSPLAFVIG